MKRMRKWLLCPLIVVALLLCAIPAYADMPTIPHAFYGTLTIAGSPAAVGTVVTAEVNEVQCGSITTTVAGQYGGSGAFDAKLTVTGEIETGATISFKVNGAPTIESYNYAFSPGAVTEHNLVVDIDPNPPVVTITALSPDPTNDNTPTFTGMAIDTLSNIASVEYQVGTGSWRVWVAADPVDGAFNSPSESYTFTIPTLADGGYTVYVRATDAASNTTAEVNHANDSFTIDTVAPTVVSRVPASGATGVAVDAVVTATFSEAMDASTITTGSFTLKIGATPVSGSVSYNAGTYTATFTPSANLANNTIYTASLSTAVTDIAGNALGAASTWNFTTGSPPGVVTVSIDAPAGVAADSDFTANVTISDVTDFDACQYDVTFDATVLRLDEVTAGEIDSTAIPVDIYNELAPGVFRVIQNVPNITGVSGSGHLAVLHFHAIGSEGESSAIDLSNGVLSSILAEEIVAVWSGDTVTVADTLPPTVVSTSPAADATDVPVDTLVTATFSEAMDESTITTGSFTVAGVSGSVSYNAGTYTATFTPIIGLAYETTYTASLSTAITDAAGNPLASTYSWSFTTAPIPPGTVLVSIDAPDGPRENSSFTANVDIGDVTDFDACQYDVTFDPLVLRLDDVTAGLIGSTTVPVDIYNELSAGTYRVVQNVPGLTGATGSGYLAVLNFFVIGSAGDVSIIVLSNGTLSNILAEEITAVWVGDSVTITRRPSGGGGGGGGGGAPPDTTPPAISNVAVSNVSKTSANVAWNTDEESDSQVEYWASPGVVTPLNTELVTEHIVNLDELTPGNNYW